MARAPPEIDYYKRPVRFHVTAAHVSRGVATAVLRARDVALHARPLVELAVEDCVVGARVGIGWCAAQEERVLSAGCVEDAGGALAEDVLHRKIDAADRDANAEEHVEGVPREAQFRHFGPEDARVHDEG